MIMEIITNQRTHPGLKLLLVFGVPVWYKTCMGC